MNPEEIKSRNIQIVKMIGYFNTEPLKVWLKKSKYKQEFCGLVSLNHFKDCYGLYYDFQKEMKSDNPRFPSDGYGYKGVVTDIETSQEVCLSSIPPKAIMQCILYFNKDEYSKHCREYKEYNEWLNNRNTQRYVDIESHNQKIDGKNLLHCVRLINTAKEIVRDKTINVRRPEAQYLIDIRKGKYDLKTILDKCTEDLKELEKAFDESDLPDSPDRGSIIKLVTKMRKEYYEYNKTLS